MITKYLIIFVILTFYLAVLFLIRSRTTMIIFIILANLISILFYSLTIPDGQNLKELIIADIIFCAIILTLISNSNHIYNLQDVKTENLKLIGSFLLNITLAIIIAAGVFYLTKNIDKISVIVKEKQTIRENEIAKNPLLSTSHAAHINIKKYYLGENYDSKIFDLTQNSNAKELHSEKYQEKLRANILFKRLTDAIIIICGIITVLFLYNLCYQSQCHPESRES